MGFFPHVSYTKSAPSLVSQRPKFGHGRTRPQHGDAHPLASGDGTGTQRGSDVEGAFLEGREDGRWSQVDVSEIYRNFTVLPEFYMVKNMEKDGNKTLDDKKVMYLVFIVLCFCFLLL